MAIEEIIIDDAIVRYSNQLLVGGFHYAGQHIQWWSQTLHLASGEVIENCYDVNIAFGGMDYLQIWYADFSRTLDYYTPHFQAIIDKENEDASTET